MRYFFIGLGLLACSAFQSQPQDKGEDPEDLSGTTNQDNSGLETTNTDNNTSTATETATDTSTSTGTSTTTETETETEEQFDCEDGTINNPFNDGECYTQMLNCGDSFTMHTSGGTSFYDEEQYTGWYALSSVGADYTGKERAFYFIHPGDGITANIRLESPCEDMNLLYFRTWNEEECYENPGSCTPCQGDHDVSEERNDDDYLQIFDTNDNSYLIIVESRTGVDSPFTLSMNCDD